MLAFIDERGLLVSSEKSTVSLFSPYLTELKKKLSVYINNELVKHKPQPTILGLKLDTKLTYTPDISKQCAKLK